MKRAWGVFQLAGCSPPLCVLKGDSTRHHRDMHMLNPGLLLFIYTIQALMNSYENYA